MISKLKKIPIFIVLLMLLINVLPFNTFAAVSMKSQSKTEEKIESQNTRDTLDQVYTISPYTISSEPDKYVTGARFTSDPEGNSEITTVPAHGLFYVHYDWEIPDDETIEVGDKLVISAPKKVIYRNSSSFDVNAADDDSMKIGDGRIDTNAQEITVIFNETAAELSQSGVGSIKGSIRVRTELDIEYQTEDREEEIHIPGIDGAIHITVPGHTPDPGDPTPQPQDWVIKKWGYQTDEEGVFQWMARVNGKLEYIEEAVLVDTLRGNHELISDSIEVFEGTAWSNSALLEYIDVSDDFKSSGKIEERHDGFTINFGTIQNKGYDIMYQTKINDDLSQAGGNTYDNTLDFTGKQINQVTQEYPIVYTSGSGTVTGNYQRAKVRKIDSDTGESLREATFKVVSKDGKEVDGPLVTNAKGEATTKILSPGEYSFIETRAPAGYKLDPTPHDFTIVDGQNSSTLIEVENTEITGGVIVRKVEAGHTEKRLAGAVFRLEDETGHVLEELLETDQNGILDIQNLKPGTYQLVETKAPVGYELDETPHQFIIESNATTAVEIDIPNNPKNGSVILLKTNSNNTKALSNAEFTLLDHEKKELQTGLTTNKFGVVSVDNLEPGEYYFKETKAPPGYELDDTLIRFTITEGQKTAKTVRVKNQLIKGSALLKKKDTKTGQTLEGAEFKVVDDKGKVVADKLVTDNQGEVSSGQLIPGTYYFIETKAPVGYKLDETPRKFVIDEDSSSTVEIIMGNTRVIGSARLIKKDSATNEVLEGAEFKLIKYKDGQEKVIAEKLKTDSQGALSSDSLSPGDYALIETKAPVGYIIDETPIKFSIIEGEDTFIEKVMPNKVILGNAILVKKDSDTHGTLAGAEFELRNDKGDLISVNGSTKLVTDDKGEISSGPLRPGRYQFVETRAPDGYRLDTTPIEFEIEKGSTDVIKLELLNDPILLPETGGIGRGAFIGSGTIALLTSLVVYNQSKKRRRCLK
ncbi:MAG: SpaA isopeptide-forming pilin-related protein [Vagococcus sp.]